MQSSIIHAGSKTENQGGGLIGRETWGRREGRRRRRDQHDVERATDATRGIEQGRTTNSTTLYEHIGKM